MLITIIDQTTLIGKRYQLQNIPKEPRIPNTAFACKSLNQSSEPTIFIITAKARITFPLSKSPKCSTPLLSRFGHKTHKERKKKATSKPF